MKSLGNIGWMNLDMLIRDCKIDVEDEIPFQYPWIHCVLGLDAKFDGWSDRPVFHKKKESTVRHAIMQG